MEKRKVFAVFSAAVLSAAMLGGCSDGDSSSYSERTAASVVTTTDGIVEWTTKAAETTETDAETITKETKKSKNSEKKDKTSEKTTTVEAYGENSADENAEKKPKTTKNSDKKDKTSKKTKTSEANGEEITTEVFDLGDGTYVEYHFRSKKLLNQHFEKHGGEFDGDFDYGTAAEYEKGASDVINSEEALHKTEAEDGDFVYYIEATNEFVILSTDGYIRTYFRPSGGIDYYNRQ